jgi:hypothetical protein
MPKPRAIKKGALPALSASQHRRRKAIRSDRWTRWARMLEQRHGRIAVRYRALAFILARNQAVSFRQIERWHHSSSQLLPKIRLSIGPVFLRYLNKGMGSLFGAPASKSFTWLSHRFNAEQHVKPHDSHQPSSESYLRTPADPYPPSQAAGHNFQNSLFQPALMRVFTRLDEVVQSSASTSFETRLVQSSLQLVNRVTEERRRVEDSRRSLASREQREYARVLRNARSPEAVVFESARALPAAPAGSAQARDAWSLDIERLTEQVVRSIDSRIIAHRERTGRVF